MIGYWNYTVYLTYFGLCTAVFGIIKAAQGDPYIALLCLMISGVCDMFDGTIARTCKTRSEDAKNYGIQLDSLCDTVCFGVLPATIGYCLCGDKVWAIVCELLFVLAAIIRLGYFNVQEMNRIQNEGGKRHSYTGLPVTASAIIFPLYCLVSVFLPFNIIPYYPIMLIVTALLFLMKVEVKKPYMRGMILLGTLGACIFVLFIVFGGRL